MKDVRSPGPERFAGWAYTPYGHHMPGATCGVPGFNGELHEAALGWQLLGNGYRAYNPVLMRFQSPDGQSPFAEGGLNAYAYCQADPVNATDPTGHGFLPRPTSASPQGASLPKMLRLPKLNAKGGKSPSPLRAAIDQDRSDLQTIKMQLDQEIAVQRKNANLPPVAGAAGDVGAGVASSALAALDSAGLQYADIAAAHTFLQVRDNRQSISIVSGAFISEWAHSIRRVQQRQGRLMVHPSRAAKAKTR